MRGLFFSVCIIVSESVFLLLQDEIIKQEALHSKATTRTGNTGLQYLVAQIQIAEMEMVLIKPR